MFKTKRKQIIVFIIASVMAVSGIAMIVYAAVGITKSIRSRIIVDLGDGQLNFTVYKNAVETPNILQEIEMSDGYDAEELEDIALDRASNDCVIFRFDISTPYPSVSYTIKIYKAGEPTVSLDALGLDIVWGYTAGNINEVYNFGTGITGEFTPVSGVDITSIYVRVSIMDGAAAGEKAIDISVALVKNVS